MNSKDLRGGEEDYPQWRGIHAELSQSTGSEALSLPSGNRLADISLSSDFADSDFENEDTVLTNAPQQSINVIGNVTSDMQHDDQSVPRKPVENKQQKSGGSALSEYSFDTRPTRNISGSGTNLRLVCLLEDSTSERGPSRETAWRKPHGLSDLSLGDVKVALQENCNLLTDQHLLDDLLKSLDEKMQKDQGVHSNQSKRIQNYRLPVVKPNRDPGLNIGESRITNQASLNGKDSMSGAPHQEIPIQLQVPTLTYAQSETLDMSSQSVPWSLNTKSLSVEGHEFTLKGKGDPSAPRTSEAYKEELAASFNSEKHVTFDDSAKEEDSHLPSENEGRNLLHPCASNLSIIKQLSKIRWSLQGWEEIQNNPITDGTSPVTLIHQLLNRLQVLQLEKKHLENELAASRVALQEVQEVNAVKDGMYEQQKARMVEADQQLETLQKEWMAAQDVVKARINALKDQCHQFKEEKESLKLKINSLKNEEIKQKEAVKDYADLKVSLKEAEEQIASRSKQASEIYEENCRLNICLQEREEQLKDLVKVKVPELVKQLEGAKHELERLCEERDGAVNCKRAVEDKLRVLTLQHQALLSRVVREQQEKETVTMDKMSLENEVKQLREEVSRSRNEAHQHYQSQVETLVAQKSALLQSQLSQLELKMKNNIRERLDTERQIHHQDCIDIKQGYEKKIQELTVSNEATAQKQNERMGDLERENKQLKAQQERVLSAITVIMKPTHQDQCGTFEAPIKDSVSSVSPPTSPSKCGFSWSNNSQSNSRPDSGKSARNIPPLGLKSSSSSDSEGSVFQDGRQTVRPRVGASPCILPALAAKNSGTLPRNSKTASTPCQKNLNQFRVDPNSSSSEREFKSLPDLRRKACVDRNLFKSSQFCFENECTDKRKSGNNLIVLNQRVQDSPQPYSVNVGSQVFTKRIFKASEILNASEYTEDEKEVEVKESDQYQEDQQITRALETIRKEMVMRVEAGSGVEAGTLELTGDQEPATLTLQKLSEVSSLLSQYVTQTR
ncbi:hypothetical protein Pmani_017424 [Petrolisthes manimaculis]|uniref:Uncharacterized protein n=1 Tax=Petrolisthes manimaculis TaxID=1843537 RepID=A0AAE1U9F1_9EUCA|nr:hypothetical protein Pmani_017424 [Petrolisthes manimaculis]